MQAYGDPGFLTTSRMLLESGLCIALEVRSIVTCNALCSRNPCA